MAAATGVVAAAVAVLMSSMSMPQPPTAVLFPKSRPAAEGMERRYKVELASDVDLNGAMGDAAGAASQTAFHVVFRGTAALMIYRGSIGAAEARLSLSDATFTGATEAGFDESKLREEFARGVLLDLTDDGRIRARRDDDEAFETMAGESLRMLASTVQATLPFTAGGDGPGDGPRDRWRATEQDGTGEFAAAYEVLNATDAVVSLRRTKTGYETVASNGGAPATNGGAAPGAMGLAATVQGEHRLEMDRATGWVRAVRGEETAEVRLGDSNTPFSKAKSRIELRFEDERPMRDEDLLVLRARASGGGPRADAEGDAVLLTGFDRNLARAKIGERATVASLAAEADAMTEKDVERGSGDGLEMLMRMRAYMALHEADLSELRAELAKRPTTDLFVQATLGAAAISGCRSCQELLVGEVATRSEVGDKDTRVALLANFSQVPLPSRQSEAFVRARVAGETDEDVRRTTHFLLGVFAFQLQHLDAARTKAIIDEYAAKLSAARFDDDKLLALDVLGNSGNERVVEIVKPYLKDPSPEIRERAVTALRLVVTQKAAELAKAALGDPAAGVRDAAVRVLSDRPAAEAYVPTLVEHLGSEKDDLVKRQVLRALDSHSALPVVQQALSRVADDDVNPTIRDLAVRIRDESPSKAALLQ